MLLQKPGEGLNTGMGRSRDTLRNLEAWAKDFSKKAQKARSKVAKFTKKTQKIEQKM